MTIAPSTTERTFADFRLPAFDLYRDIHKGIRAELFALTGSAGTLDPSDTVGWIALAEHTSAMERTLSDHAHHEDTFIDPVLREHLADLAEVVVSDHERLDRTFADIVEIARGGADAGAIERRRLAQLAYLQLSSFTSCYLAHQAIEELDISPALERAVGPDAIVAIHMAIIGSIPPDEMAQTLTMMLPAMNVDDRTELLAGMQASAPPAAFDAVVGLAGSVLTPADFGAVARRLELPAPARR
ncbi:MAG TPA: hemerythrin domain-containing protein [Ilumatobacteraceae bacterium]|nr:hemerythrin domain-containing protein [Ilumatobacteraceae bacterium]